MVTQHFEQLTAEQIKVVDEAVDKIASTLEYMTDGEAEQLIKEIATLRGKFKIEIYLILQGSNTEGRDSIDSICLALEKDEQVRTEVLIRLNEKGLLNRKKQKEEKEEITEEYRVLAKKAHSFLSFVTIQMTPEQRAWLVNTITFFDASKHIDDIKKLLKRLDLEGRFENAIIGCLLDDESRTELIKIMSRQGFMY